MWLCYTEYTLVSYTFTSYLQISFPATPVAVRWNYW